MVNFGFLLFSKVNILKNPKEAMYLWYSIVNTLICYEYTQDFKTFCFGTIKAILRLAY